MRDGNLFESHRFLNSMQRSACWASRIARLGKRLKPQITLSLRADAQIIAALDSEGLSKLNPKLSNLFRKSSCRNAFQIPASTFSESPRRILGIPIASCLASSAKRQRSAKRFDLESLGLIIGDALHTNQIVESDEFRHPIRYEISLYSSPRTTYEITKARPDFLASLYRFGRCFEDENSVDPLIASCYYWYL